MNGNKDPESQAKGVSCVKIEAFPVNVHYVLFPFPAYRVS